MKLVVNNRDTELSDFSQLTVRELLKEMRYTFPMLVVKVNGKLVKKDRYDETIIKDGDNVAAIHLVGGG